MLAAFIIAIAFFSFWSIYFSTLVNADSLTAAMRRNRFNRILQFVRRDASVADIGGDHGILSVALANISENGRRVTYIDISDAAVHNARQSISNAGLQNSIQVFCGDGIQPLLNSREKVNTVIAAGMGCMTTIRILANNPKLEALNHYEQKTDSDCGILNEKSSMMNCMDQLHAENIIVQVSKLQVACSIDI